MNTIQALQRLVAGKKIRCKRWEKDEYWVIGEDGDLYNNLDMEVEITISDKEEILDKDWEVYHSETEKLMTNGKRWELIRICTSSNCGTCERVRKEMYKFCKLHAKPFCAVLIDANDDEIDMIYNAIKENE